MSTHPLERQPGPFDDMVSEFDTGEEPKPAAPFVPQRLEEPTLEDVHAKGTRSVIARFPCRKCRGSGRFVGYTGRDLGACFTCRGSGKQKTDPDLARKRAQKREAQRLEQVGRVLADWAPAHVAELEWIGAHCKRFDFAASMRDALAKYGHLTDGQVAAIRRCIEKDAARAKERAERKPDAEVGGAGFSRMLAAFDAAKASGLKRPKFHVGDYTFAPAKASSQNAGSIYVTHLGTYLGKISSEGAFFASRECTEEHKAEVARIGSDPLAAAVLHGQQTGSCSCCGRQLENAESVALGIGPICRAKWGLK